MSADIIVGVGTHPDAQYSSEMQTAHKRGHYQGRDLRYSIFTKISEVFPCDDSSLKQELACNMNVKRKCAKFPAEMLCGTKAS